MEYILFIHNDADKPACHQQWQDFFLAAHKSGVFRGGSEISNQIKIGHKDIYKITDHVDGFMRFEAEDKQLILALLEKHPVAIEGGTLELCEMPKSEV
jgi:hypothetical protein